MGEEVGLGGLVWGFRAADGPGNEMDTGKEAIK